MMIAAVVGTGARAEQRVRALHGLPGVSVVGPVERGELGSALGELDVLFVAVPTAEHYAVAEAAAKQGVHVFLEWPPATSLRECEALAGLAEEAGVEAGVSRPLRFHPGVAARPPEWRATLVLVRYESIGSSPALMHRLADAVDLSCALARSSSVQRIDAEAVRQGAAWPEVMALGLRFHNGAYAQVVLRQRAGEDVAHLYAASTDIQLDVDLAPVAASPLRAETEAFLGAVAERRPAPVSVLDGLHTMRIVERVMGKLR